DDDTIRELTRAVHEAQMALVEESHGGNETDGMTARALGARPGAHLGNSGELAQLRTRASSSPKRSPDARCRRQWSRAAAWDHSVSEPWASPFPPSPCSS